MITVILLCWKRFQHFEDILKFWLGQERVNQVIVFDNSGSFKTELPILLFNISENLGPAIRQVGAQFAKNDTIIFCDDDAMLEEGIVEDLERYFEEDMVVGVMGKQLTGDTYKDSTTVRGHHVKEPTKVDYVPANLCMTHRRNCLLDIRQCPNQFYLDDFWWCEQIKERGVTLWVVPTDKYGWYPEGDDSTSLHKNEDLLACREQYYKRWYKNEVDN